MEADRHAIELQVLGLEGFLRTLIEAHRVQDLTQKILESKRPSISSIAWRRGRGQDLQNVLKLTLEKFGHVAPWHMAFAPRHYDATSHPIGSRTAGSPVQVWGMHLTA